MKNTKTTPTVADRIHAVLRLRRLEAAAAPLTVSEVCRDAGVNRANLYLSHPALVQEIKAQGRGVVTSGRGRAAPDADRKTTQDAMAKLVKQNKALLLVCMELQMEVNSLRMRLSAAEAATVARRKGAKANMHGSSTRSKVAL